MRRSAEYVPLVGIREESLDAAAAAAAAAVVVATVCRCGKQKDNKQQWLRSVSVFYLSVFGPKNDIRQVCIDLALTITCVIDALYSF